MDFELFKMLATEIFGEQQFSLSDAKTARLKFFNVIFACDHLGFYFLIGEELLLRKWSESHKGFSSVQRGEYYGEYLVDLSNPNSIHECREFIEKIIS